jgi:hypothetical protein
MDAADHSNGSATRNEPISHARLSSFRPKPGQMAGIRPSAGHGTGDDAQHRPPRALERRSPRSGPPPAQATCVGRAGQAWPFTGAVEVLRDSLRSEQALIPPIRGGPKVPAALVGGSARPALAHARQVSQRTQAVACRAGRPAPRWPVRRSRHSRRDRSGSESRFRGLDAGPRWRRPGATTFRSEHNQGAETRSPARDAPTSGCRNTPMCVPCAVYAALREYGAEPRRRQ